MKTCSNQESEKRSNRWPPLKTGSFHRGERKVKSHYISPDFDPSKLGRRSKPQNGQYQLGFMLPMSIKSCTCGDYMFRGTKANSRKEVCYNEFYLGLPVYRVDIHCKNCYAEITIRMDPANADYTIEAGATRHFEPWLEQATAAAGDGPITQLESDSTIIQSAATQDKEVEKSVYRERKRCRQPEARDVARIHEEDNAGRNLSRDDRKMVATFKAVGDRKMAECVKVVRRFDGNRGTRTLLSYGDDSDT
jgi:hypothetical protein